MSIDRSLSGDVRDPRPLEPLVEERGELCAHRLRLRRELLLLRVRGGTAVLLLVVLASVLGGGGGGGGRLVVGAGAALVMI